MKAMTSSQEAPAPAASVIRIPLPPPGKVGANKQPEPEAAPLTWLNDVTAGMLRAMFPLSRLNGFDQEAPIAPETKKRRPALKGDEKGEASRTIDRVLHATMARFTLGLSPYALWLAAADWAIHLSASPGKWQQLTEKAIQENIEFLSHLSRVASNPDCPPCVEPLIQDYRFRNEEWQKLPFKLFYQSFLLTERWWQSATTGIGGVSPHHEQVVAFMARQLLDAVSPANFIATNPEVLNATIREGGQNLLRGASNFWKDWQRGMSGEPPEGAANFVPGENVAITKGKVVYRNRLIELIQYSPTTQEVHDEPVLIVPAWIMKYYILDLSPGNSFVKYLVDRGHTVFMISWHNPTAHDRDLGLNDYLRLGVFEALKAIHAIVPDAKVNAMGYCLGGTLLSMAAAYFGRQKDSPFNSLTLLASQTDFTEAGELTLFIDDSQLNYLEDIMWEQGYLDSRQMAGAFQLLRSSDLIWSRIAQEYLMGRRSPMIDLLAWNSDATHMPYRMHREYLRRLYLHNDLFEGRYRVQGMPIALSDIHVPMFVVATERDHVAPWQSVYKINLVDETGVTFVLTNGGHNAGIVSEPGHKGRRYRISGRARGEPYSDPAMWYANAKIEEGSWWPALLAWLDQHSEGMSKPPAMGAPGAGYSPLQDAPGGYVLEH
jgi:polyhydroxyalkanoate synthase subunit PhaC